MIELLLSAAIFFTQNPEKLPEIPGYEIYQESRIATKATNLIISFEGFSPRAYKDGYGYSIGYGSLARGRETITECEARNIVRKEAKRLSKKIDEVYNRYTGDSFSVDEKAAMISFAYNTPRFDPVLNHHACIFGFLHRNKERVESCMEDYRWLRGLDRRRDAELELFFGT